MLKTADYLKKAVEQSGRRPYTVAIASYALVLLKKPQHYNPLSVLIRAAAPGRKLVANMKRADILGVGADIKGNKGINKCAALL